MHNALTVKWLLTLFSFFNSKYLCTFAAVKVEEQLQLARIQIAQMKDEIAELTSRPDWTAREKELNEHHARELYEQKMFLD